MLHMNRFHWIFRHTFHFFALAMLLAGTSALAVSENDGAIYLDEPEPEPPPTVVQQYKVEDKYPDDQVRVQREVIRLSNNRIVNHGLYTEFYRDGKKFAEGSYSRGIHVGEWNYWHPNGQLCKTVRFNDGLPDGSWETFRKDGTRLSSISYAKGLRDGKRINYFEDGETIRIEENYEQNKLQGARTTYYKNGKKYQEVYFKNGLLHGTMTVWNEAGEKIRQIPFVDGKINGKLVKWKDGAATEQEYRDGNLLHPTNDNQELIPLEPEE